MSMDQKVENASAGQSALRRGLGTALCLGGFFVLNTLAGVCFKECGTDAEHTWRYFFVGNTLGPLSLIFMMMVFARLNANLTSALVAGGSSVLVQVVFWLAYHAHMATSQWAGIALVLVGAVVAVVGGPKGASSPEAQAADSDEDLAA